MVTSVCSETATHCVATSAQGQGASTSISSVLVYLPDHLEVVVEGKLLPRRFDDLDSLLLEARPRNVFVCRDSFAPADDLSFFLLTIDGFVHLPIDEADVVFGAVEHSTFLSMVEVIKAQRRNHRKAFLTGRRPSLPKAHRKRRASVRAPSSSLWRECKANCADSDSDSDSNDQASSQDDETMLSGAFTLEDMEL